MPIAPLQPDTPSNVTAHSAVDARAHIDPRTARVAAFFESISPASLATLHTIYTEHARFKDPFNDVTDLSGIRRVFTHMFDTVKNPRFVVHHTMTQGEHAWLSWDFLIDRPEGTLTVHGATQLTFAPDGRIQLHRDYWDTAEELYAKLPLIGALVRWLTRQLSATA
jgi:steroid Delta-isomerase